MNKPKILIVDDEKPTRDVMARVLARAYECLTAPDAEQAMKAVEAHGDLALVITDYKMPGENGIELIRRVKAANPLVACILITAFGEIELAVEAMKDGADDFLTKPITDLDQLELRVAKAIKTKALERKVEELEERLDTRRGFANFTGSSPAMEKIYTLIRQAAKSTATVLVEGPSGTGKELVARALHDLSPRAKGPFIAVECSALTSTLLESELFGHEKGAFTGAIQQKIGKFESAHGGTLFLDEIGEIDAATQVKLLRALETHVIQRVGGTEDVPVDFRLVAATNKDLPRLVAEGKFREDLFYRLNVIDIHLPALKDRPGDIALLVSRFLKEFSAANGDAVTGIDPQAVKALEEYPWPGNVRQLRNVIERMVVLSSGGKLTLNDIPAEIAAKRTTAGAGPASDVPDAPTRAEASRLTLDEMEKERILSVLAACNGNKSKAALELGISRRTLHRKLNEWRNA